MVLRRGCPSRRLVLFCRTVRVLVGVVFDLDVDVREFVECFPFYVFVIERGSLGSECAHEKFARRHPNLDSDRCVKT